MNEQLATDMRAYGELKLKEKEIKKDLEILKASITPQVEPGKKYVIENLGAIEVKKRDNWTYSPDLEMDMAKIEDRQKEEVARGEATSEPTIFIDFRAVKVQDENYEG